MPLSATINDDTRVIATDRDIMSLDSCVSTHVRKLPRNMPASARITPASPLNSNFFCQFARQELVSSDNFGQPHLIRASGFAYSTVGKTAYGYALSTLPFDTCHVPLTEALSHEA